MIRLVIQDRSIGSANQKASEHPLDEPSDGIIGSANHIHRSDYLRTDFLRTDHPSRRNRWISQSNPSVGLSSDGLSSDGSSIRVNRRLSQSQPSVGLFRSDYLQTDFLRTDHPSVRNPQDNQVTRASRTGQNSILSRIRHPKEDAFASSFSRQRVCMSDIAWLRSPKKMRKS